MFGALRSAFQSPELIEAFDAALQKERAKQDGADLEKNLAAAKTALSKTETGQENILKAIAEGAPYATFKAKAEAYEAKREALTRRIAELETQIAQSDLPQEDARTIYASALAQMETLLSDLDLVDEASTYLKVLIKQVTLTPDEAAQHGIQAEIELAEAGGLGLASSGGAQRTDVVC